MFRPRRPLSTAFCTQLTKASLLDCLAVSRAHLSHSSPPAPSFCAQPAQTHSPAGAAQTTTLLLLQQQQKCSMYNAHAGAYSLQPMHMYTNWRHTFWHCIHVWCLVDHSNCTQYLHAAHPCIHLLEWTTWQQWAAIYHCMLHELMHTHLNIIEPTRTTHICRLSNFPQPLAMKSDVHAMAQPSRTWCSLLLCSNSPSWRGSLWRIVL